MNGEKSKKSGGEPSSQLQGKPVVAATVPGSAQGRAEGLEAQLPVEAEGQHGIQGSGYSGQWCFGYLLDSPGRSSW